MGKLRVRTQTLSLIAMDTAYSNLEDLQGRQVRIQKALADAKIITDRYQEELDDLDKQERELRLQRFAKELMDDPVKLMAIGRQFLVAALEDDRLVVSPNDLRDKINSFLTDDQCRYEFELLIQFGEIERKVISQINGLSADELRIVKILYENVDDDLHVGSFREGTEISYSKVNAMLQRLITCGLVRQIRSRSCLNERDLISYRLSKSVTVRIMEWGVVNQHPSSGAKQQPLICSGI